MLSFFKDAVETRDGHGFLVIWTKIAWGKGKIQRNFENFYYDK